MRDSGFSSISPNLAKSTLGHGSRLRPPPDVAPPDTGARARGQRVLDVGRYILAYDAAAVAAALDLMDIHAELAREGADCRGGIRCIAGHDQLGIERRTRLRRDIAFRCIAGENATAAQRRGLFFDLRCRRRGRCGSFRGWRLGFGRGRTGRGSVTGSLDDGDHRTFGHLVAHLQLYFFDHAGKGRGHFHRRLVRLERDEALVLLDLVAGLDHHLDHGHIGVADIRDAGFFKVGHDFSCRAKAATLGRAEAGRKASIIATDTCHGHAESAGKGHPHTYAGNLPYSAAGALTTRISRCGNGIRMPSASKRSFTARSRSVCAGQKSAMCV